MTPKILVLRYNNRKLYSVNESKYTTLSKLKDDIENGLHITVMDYDTNRDETLEILTKIVGREPEKYFTKEELYNKITNNTQGVF